MKRLILGLVVGLLIGSAATAFAATDTVTATVAKFRFIVNGEERDVKTEQLVVMGTTYLPVREVANMLGYDVTYRADSQTIELQSAKAPAKEAIQPQEQEVDLNMDEWIQLRELAVQNKLTVAQVTHSSNVYRVSQGETVWFEVDLSFAEDSTTVVKTSSGGDVRITKSKGITYVNLEDLRASSLIQ